MKLSSSGRKALQPRNIFPSSEPQDTFVKPKALRAPPKQQDNKTVTDASSLAEELTAFKKKLERLRDDLDRTQELLDRRDAAMDLQMASLIQRGEAQKVLEIQVDRLFRLKELHAYSSKVSPMPSLRAKELDKRTRLSIIEPAGDAVEPEEEEEEQVSERC